MKKIAMLTALTALSFANAQEVVKQENPHNVYFGPVGFWQNFEVDANTMDDEDVEVEGKVKSNGYFGGAKIGYEHLKKDSIYFGVDGTFAAGRAKDELVSTTEKEHRTALWGNAESRLGYNFGGDSFRISPFVGIGWDYYRPTTKVSLSFDWFYGTAGFKSTKAITDIFDLGLNAKAMYNFRPSVNADKISVHGKGQSWGYELGLPLTWHVDQAKNWDVQLEPYFAQLSTKLHDKQAGGRLMFNYKF